MEPQTTSAPSAAVRGHCGQCLRTYHIGKAWEHTQKCSATKSLAKEGELWFGTKVAAMLHMKEHRLDAQFSILQSKPTLVIYDCARAVRPSRTKAEQDGQLKLATKGTRRALFGGRGGVGSGDAPKTGKKKPRRKECRRTEECPARVIIRQEHVCNCGDVGRAQGKVCTTSSAKFRLYFEGSHTHVMEYRNLKLSAATRDVIVASLELGLTPQRVYALNFRDEGLPETPEKLVTLKDILNVSASYCPKQMTGDELTNICRLLQGENYHTFNLKQHISEDDLPPEVARKYDGNTTDEEFVTYQSEAMRQRFQKHPSLLFVDGTHDVSRTSYKLIVFAVRDENGEGAPVFFGMCREESNGALLGIVSTLAGRNRDACDKVEATISDCAKPFRNAWEACVSSASRHIYCSWHILKNWKKHASKVVCLAPPLQPQGQQPAVSCTSTVDAAAASAAAATGGKKPTVTSAKAKAKNKKAKGLTANTAVKGRKRQAPPSVEVDPCASDTDQPVAKASRTRSLYGDWCALRLQGTSSAFQATFSALERKWRGGALAAKWSGMVDKYGTNGTVAPTATWARHIVAGSPTTNMTLERMNRTLKDILTPSLRFDTALSYLAKVDQLFVRKDLLVGLGMRSANLEKRPAQMFAKCHPQDFGQYNIVSEGDDSFLVQKLVAGNWKSFYRVQPNWLTCNRDICKVFCKHCPASSRCGHRLTCTCPAYMERNVCKHLHVVEHFHGAGLAHAEAQPVPGDATVDDMFVTPKKVAVSAASTPSQTASPSANQFTPLKDMQANTYMVACMRKAANYYERDCKNLPLEVQRTLRETIQPCMDYALRVMSECMTPDKRFRVRKPNKALFASKPKRRKLAFNPALASMGMSSTVFQENVLSPCLNDDTLQEPCWHDLLCLQASPDVNHVLDTAVAAMEPDQRNKFTAAMEEAKCFWSCHQCKELPVDKLQDFFVSCTKCKNRYHGTCAGVQDFDEGQPEWCCSACK